MTPRVFPINTASSCVLKWGWSTIFLRQGTSSSCHRTDQYAIPRDNLASFHNLPEKQAARAQMLQGQWPQAGCQYCEKIEQAGGMSDRLYQFDSGHDAWVTPDSVLADPTTLEAVPRILEIYFDNTCNMACLYCGNHFSSKWEEEDRRFGEWSSEHHRFGHIRPVNTDYARMLEQFWQYLHDEDRYLHIRQYQVAGGEPFFQDELEQSIEFWDKHPNPEVTFNFITNLKVPQAKLQRIMERLGHMVEQGKIKRVQISSSLDAWGPQEEYIRWGLKLSEWEENFRYVMTLPWVVQCINCAMSALSVKHTAPLLQRWADWNHELRPSHRQIHFSLMTTTFPPIMDPENFGSGVFEADFAEMLSVMPSVTPHERSIREHVEGIARQIANTPRHPGRIRDLKLYLDEIDRRRGTNWRNLFPWLDQDWQ